jgi:hypothetical protein
MLKKTSVGQEHEVKTNQPTTRNGGYLSVVILRGQHSKQYSCLLRDSAS